MSYKLDLEKSQTILEIQIAYERECYRRFLSFQKSFPDDCIRMIEMEHLSIWLTAEKYAIDLFGININHWIKQVI